MNAGTDPENDEVVLNSLSAFGSQYLMELEMQQDLAVRMINAVVVPYHSFAIAKREAGYVMDHPMQYRSIVGRSGTIDQGLVAGAEAMFGSGLEHASYEEFQEGEAISTIKALYLANQGSQKIYKVNKTSLPSILNELTGYSDDELTVLQEPRQRKRLLLSFAWKRFDPTE